MAARTKKKTRGKKSVAKKPMPWSSQVRGHAMPMKPGCKGE